MLATILTSVLAVLLAAYGAQRAVAVVVVLWVRRPPPPSALRGDEGNLPAVTVQLPLFNEAAVCARIVDAAAALAWPRHLLQVQVLDDSTDETSDLVAARCAVARSEGVDIVHVRRTQRDGFKAGALAAGLTTATGEFVAIFDADFCPASDFLLRAVAPFVHHNDDDRPPDVVQCRWGHLNRNHSWLTRAQALLLDVHFTLEHQARALTGRFFPFNGTAGIWRKQAIVDAGGWDARTLTEDLDLSLRAWAGGARFVYLDNVEVMAELPAAVNAWKLQQHRWAKGSMQTLKARLSTVARARRSLAARIDAGLRLTQNVSFLLLLLLCALLPAAALERADAGSRSIVDLSALGLGTLPVIMSFIVGSRLRKRSFFDAIVDVPFALLAGAGLAINNGRAVLEGMFSSTPSIFARTPKSGDHTAGARPSALRAPPLTLTEFGLGVGHVVVAALLCSRGHFDLTPFLWLCGVGLLLASLGSLREASSNQGDSAATHQHDTRPERLLPNAGRSAGEIRLMQEGQQASEGP